MDLCQRLAGIEEQEQYKNGKTSSNRTGGYYNRSII